MHHPRSERAHVERTLRVVDHVERIVTDLDATASSIPADLVDGFARRVLTEQWRHLSRAARRPAAPVVDLVGQAVTEFVVLRYLSQLMRHDANALIAARSRVDADEADRAHDVDARPSRNDPDDRPAVDHERLMVNALSDLGHRLGWALDPADRLGRHALPTDRWLAAAVGELHLYDRLSSPRSPQADAQTLEFQLGWANVLLCRTANIVQQLVRSSDPLPTTPTLVELAAECAAAVPAATTARRSVAC